VDDSRAGKRGDRLPGGWLGERGGRGGGGKKGVYLELCIDINLCCFCIVEQRIAPPPRKEFNFFFALDTMRKTTRTIATRGLKQRWHLGKNKAIWAMQQQREYGRQRGRKVDGRLEE
jgi:hypothetical protein